jgi:hypothetical protein
MTKQPRPKLPRLKPPPWTDRADALVRVAHPDFVAVKLGVPVAMVLARGAELALAAVEQRFPIHR